MKFWYTILLLILVLFGFTKLENNPVYLKIPKNWPKPKYDFKNNPLTEEGIALGRALFYDPILSKDSTISCASCHLPATAFTHVDHDLSHGIDGKIGTRNSLTLQNLLWSTSFMWDGGVNHLEVQPLAPITSAVEMNEKLENVVQKLQNTNSYPNLFYKAYGSKTITGQLTLKALTQFMLTLISANSKYDKVMLQQDSFTEMEKKGYALFQKNCAQCHKEPLFQSDDFENNGLAIDSTLKDYGRMKITLQAKDSLRFKVPTLRNIEFSYPYMHDGRFKNLQAVLRHYETGVQKSKTLSEKLKKPIQFTANERTELIAFLKTLSDKEFLFNPKHNFPKKN